MKVVCRTSALTAGLQSAARVVSPRATLPILQNVKLEATIGEEGMLSITGTDMNTCVKRIVPAQVEKEGATTVQAKLLADLIASFPETDITMELQDASLIIHDDGSEHLLPTVPADEFPIMPEIAEGVTFTIDQATLRKLIRQSVFAAATEETAGVCTGVLIEAEEDSLSLVATDTHRMAIARTKLSEPVERRIEAVIPATVLRDINRLLTETEETVHIAIDAAHIQLETKDMQCITLKMQGQFPNYKRVIPKSFTRRLELNSATFLSALRRVSLHVGEHTRCIVLHIERDKMTITAEDPEAGRGSGREVIPTALDGEPLLIAFNASFLMDFFNVLESDTAIMEMNENYQAVVIRPVESEDEEGEQESTEKKSAKGAELEDGEWLYVVMPMQPPEQYEG